MTSTLPGPTPSTHCHDTPAESQDTPTVSRQVPVEPSQPMYAGSLPQPTYEGRDSEANGRNDPVQPVNEPEPEPVTQVSEPEQTTQSQVPLRRSVRANAGKPPARYSPSVFDLS